MTAFDQLIENAHRCCMAEKDMGLGRCTIWRSIVERDVLECALELSAENLPPNGSASKLRTALEAGSTREGEREDMGALGGISLNGGSCGSKRPTNGVKRPTYADRKSAAAHDDTFLAEVWRPSEDEIPAE